MCSCHDHESRIVDPMEAAYEQIAADLRARATKIIEEGLLDYHAALNCVPRSMLSAGPLVRRQAERIVTRLMAYE